MSIPLNILISFPYWKDSMGEILSKRDPNSFRLMIDSGAFTAWNVGKHIDIDAYCTFLDSLRKRLTFSAVQLDVIGDQEESFKNLLIMKKRGFDVMPVFTRGGDINLLEELYKLSDVIMLGGVVSGEGNKNYFRWFIERNKGRKVHWLGFVLHQFIKHYRPYSCDSSSWMSAGRYAGLSMYKGNGKLDMLTKRDFAKQPDNETVKALMAQGFTFEEIKRLAMDEGWKTDGNLENWETTRERRNTSHCINASSHILRAMDFEKHCGTRVFLALATEPYLRSLLYVYDLLERRGLLNQYAASTK